MNKLFTFISTILFGTSIHAQHQEETPFSFNNLKKKEIVLPQPPSRLSIHFFDNISVIDVRFDSSTIGFYNNNYFIFNNASKAIEDYLSQSFIRTGNNTGNQVVLYIKKIWLATQLQSKNINATYLDEKNWQGGIACKMECYNKKDSAYYPLFRFDTIIITKNSKIQENAFSLLYNCISAIADKILSTYSEGVHTKAKKISFEEINKHYFSQFAIPILGQFALKKGVYANFESFKNNSPTDINFEINQEKLADILYIKDSVTAQMYPVRNVWGYSDGKQAFIKSADNYFPIYKINNSFYCNGAKSIDRKAASRAENAAASYFLFGNTSSNVKKTKYKIHYKSYQVDMETGEIY
jgi:hypothetical protein